MNHELTKQLKDAGGPVQCVNGEGCGVCKAREHTQDNLTRPSLSELIEACGERFFSIYRPNIPLAAEWIAETFEDDWVQREGQTPEEAVARLWLALNQKND